MNTELTRTETLIVFTVFCTLLFAGAALLAGLSDWIEKKTKES